MGSIQILREPCICSGSGDGDVMSNLYPMERQQHHLSSILFYSLYGVRNASMTTIASSSLQFSQSSTVQYSAVQYSNGRWMECTYLEVSIESSPQPS